MSIEEMCTEQNRALVRRWIEAINGGDWAALDDILAPEFALEIPGSPRLLSRESLKRAEMLDWVTFPPAQYTIEQMVAEGDWIAVWMTFRGVHTAPYRGVAPTGKEVADASVLFARCSGGKVAEAKFLYDIISLWGKLGVVHAPRRLEL